MSDTTLLPLSEEDYRALIKTAMRHTYGRCECGDDQVRHASEQAMGLAAGWHFQFVAKRAEETVELLTRQLALATDGLKRISVGNGREAWVAGVTLNAVNEAGNG